MDGNTALLRDLEAVPAWSSILCFRADARSLPLPDESVDIITTDPPYNHGKPYDSWNDNLPEDEYWAFMRDWLLEAKRVLKLDGVMYFSHSNIRMWRVKETLDETGWRFLRLIIWARPNYFAQRNRGQWSLTWEPIFYVSKGANPKLLKAGCCSKDGWLKHKKTGGCCYLGLHDADVLRYPSPQSNWKKEPRVLPAQKPVGLFRHLIAKTPGEIVLDPFMGSGAAVVAAASLGRIALGSDLSENYVRGFQNRLKQGLYDRAFTALNKQAIIPHRGTRGREDN